MNLLLTPISAVAAAFAWTTPQWHHTPWLIALGVFGNLSQVFLAKSLATAPASAVMPFDFLRLIFIAVIGFVFFDEVSDPWTWVGALVIFGSAYLVARDEIRRG
jgi:drug/metabolite transporter (DMT)-like permease